jgi:hypothetical protein
MKPESLNAESRPHPRHLVRCPFVGIIGTWDPIHIRNSERGLFPHPHQKASSFYQNQEQRVDDGKEKGRKTQSPKGNLIQALHTRHKGLLCLYCTYMDMDICISIIYQVPCTVPYMYSIRHTDYEIYLIPFSSKILGKG